MNVVGMVDSLWRYPIKSMAGEALPEAFVDYAGVYGDRIFAFLNSAGHRGLPYFTGRDRGQMLLYRPRFRNPQIASKPFRADLYAQLGTAKGFGEDAFVGRRLQIGSRVVIAVLEQDAHDAR